MTITEEENAEAPPIENKIYLLRIKNAVPGRKPVTSFNKRKEFIKEIKRTQKVIDDLEDWLICYEEGGDMRVNENDDALKWVFPKSTEVQNKSDSDDEDKDQGASSGDCHEPKKKEMSMTMLLLSMLVDIPTHTRGGLTHGMD